jgi:hypothetical protein
VSRAQRFGLIAVAVVIAVAAFVLARPDDEDEGEKAAETTETQPATTSPRAAPVKPPGPPVPRIRIAGGKPTGGVKSIKVKTGERVRFAVSSGDTTDEVHVHGYDLIRNLAPGKPVRFSFRARLEGVFEIELEHSHTPIAKLVVSPS